MSDLIAIAYPDRFTAEMVRATLTDLMAQRAIELEAELVVTRDEEGKVKLHQAPPPAAEAAAGLSWEGLVGVLFLAPLIGMAIGAAAGRGAGALGDVGIDDKFVKKLDRSLTPGSAALILLVPKVTAAKVLPYLQRHGGEIIQSSLNQETETQLHEALQPAGAAATPGAA
jgi:uncharacterized membrane protein